MSYDVHLTIDTGAGNTVSALWENHTSNTAPMWRAAGADIAEMHGKTARECAPILRAAIAAMRADPAKYQAMNPPNGWGDYGTCRSFLERLADGFEEHPNCIVGVSR